MDVDGIKDPKGFIPDMEAWRQDSDIVDDGHLIIERIKRASGYGVQIP